MNKEEAKFYANLFKKNTRWKRVRLCFWLLLISAAFAYHLCPPFREILSSLLAKLPL